jgi:hypothetical protein
VGRQTTRSVRKRETGRLRRRLAGSVLMALAAAVLVAPAASAAPEPIGSSELHWGIKSGFRSYITGIAAGTITASDGAAKEGSGASAPYLWSGDGGSYDPAANAGTIPFNGTVKFSAPAHTIWNITIEDPTVVLDGDGTAILRADVTYATGGTASAPAEQGSVSDVAFADLAVAAPSGTGTYTFSNVAATLTAAGSEAFGGFYAAGTALDPLTFSVSSAPPPTVSIGDATVVEGDSGTKNATFTVSLSQPRKSSVSVKYATANGTAVAPSDFTAKAPTQLSFSAGQTSKTVAIALKPDAFGEDDETFSLVLSAPVGVVIDDGQATATIVNDDDPAPEVSVGDVSIVEGASLSKNVVFTVQLSAPAQGAVSLKYKTVNGSAVAPGDYTAKAPTALSFQKGQTSKSVTVSVKGDKVDEPDETFHLVVSDASAGLVIGDGTATGTIVDDD